MATKQIQGSLTAPDGSHYVTLTDGAGNLSPATGGNTGPSGGAEVEGTIASGATDSGNPVKVGGRYNSVTPSLSNGQRGDIQLTANSSVRTSIIDASGTTGVQAGTTATDGATTSTGALLTAAYPYMFNGTTWDRARGDTSNGIWTVATSQYPKNSNGLAVAVTASSTGTAAVTTATLPGVASKTTYISGFTITADATAATAGTATVTGTIGGTLNFIQNVGSATSAASLTQTFNPAIPASAANTAITVNSIAAGTGGNTAVTVWGYQL